MYISLTQRKILDILADAQFHSGTELAKKIGISRSAICKQLKCLHELGIEFSAVSGKGYCLEYPLRLLSESQMAEYLNSQTRALISSIEIHDCLNSTNSYLRDQSVPAEFDAGINKGLVCFAEYQTAGRGRRGREWVSPFGSNIYLSILWHFQNGPASISGLSLAVGVAVIRALKECGIEGAGLKWPNDIYWQGKKLAGILIEVSGEASGPCNAVIGLGLNFYIPESKAKSITQDWVDLNQIVDNSFEIRNKMAALLLNHLMMTIAGFEEDVLESYLNEWRLYDCMKGKQVNLFMGQKTYYGQVEGIDNNGMLLLSDEQGELKTFASGEVSFSQS